MACSSNKFFIGIDFGTTSCKFGCFINGKVEIFEDEFGNKSMPSYVAFTQYGRLVGEKAKRQMGENQRNTAFAVKKLMGKTFEDAVALDVQFSVKLIKMDHELCGVEVYNEGEKLKLFPEQVAAMLFSKMKYLSEKKLKHPVNAAVISVPPGFNSCQRKATVNAGTIAGFDDVRLVDDSTAVATAISYQEMVGEKSENVAIVDSGGGFISFSMIFANKTIFKEFPSVTLEFGGIDIDKNIRDILNDKLLNQNHSIRDNEKLRLSAEEAKITISSQEETSIIHMNERITLTSNKIDYDHNVGHKIVILIEKLKASFSGPSTMSHIDQVILTGEFTKSQFIKNKLTKLNEDREIKKFIEFSEGVITGAVLESAVQRGLVNRRCSDSILNRTVKLDGDVLFENNVNTMKNNVKDVHSRMILTEYSGPMEKPIRTGIIQSKRHSDIFNQSSSEKFRVDPNKFIHTPGSQYRFLCLFSMPNEYLKEFKDSENIFFKNQEMNYVDDNEDEGWTIDNNEDKQKMVTNSSISEDNDFVKLEIEIHSHGGGSSKIQPEIIERTKLNSDDKKSRNSAEKIDKLMNKRSVPVGDRLKAEKTSGNILYPGDISEVSPEDCLRFLSSLREKKQISTSTGGLTMGIDFGTNKCCVAALVGRNIEVIANEKCKKTTPSYITFSDKERYFGEDSKNSALIMIDKTIIEPKNKIFQSESPDSFSVKCKSEDYSLNSVQICSMLIKYMKEVPDNHLGQDIKDAVICVPTYFNNKHRQDIKEAASIAGLNVMSILNEPTAAAINYKMNNSEEKTKNINILVFDLGSGGLSVALVGIKEDKLKVYGIDGTTEVSGNVMDDKLVNHFKGEIFKKHRTNIDGRKATEKLKLVCQKIRYELTGLPSITKLLENFDGTSDYKCEINRQQFEKMNNDMNEKIIDILDKLFSDSNFLHSQVDEILMCGGISRVPLMRKFLSDYFVQRGASCKFSSTVNKDEAVALGAAYHAACLSNMKSIVPLHVEDLIFNPEYNMHGEKLWITVPQKGGKLIEIAQKKHIITSSGILWSESSEKEYDMKILKELKSDIDAFNKNDKEQLQLAEARNEFESKCLNEKKKFNKLKISKTINDKLATKVMSHCDEVLDSLGEDDNIDLSTMREYRKDFEEFVKKIYDEVETEQERKRVTEGMKRKRVVEEMEKNINCEKLESKSEMLKKRRT